MTPVALTHERPIHAGGLALRASLSGIVPAGVLAALAVLSGWLPADTGDHVLVGFGVAALTGALGLTALAVFGTLRHDDARVAQGYLAALVGNLLLQMLGAVGGTLLVFSATQKFASAAAFGLAFAATATVLQLCGSLVISGSLRARARGTADGAQAATGDRESRRAPDHQDASSPR